MVTRVRAATAAKASAAAGVATAKSPQPKTGVATGVSATAKSSRRVVSAAAKPASAKKPSRQVSRQTRSGAALSALLRGQIRNQSVLAAIAQQSRESFLDESMVRHGKEDVALPIGYGQTTSQPFVIGRMLEMLMSTVPPPAKILEVGVGCGYQTAILSQLGYTVVGVERIRALMLSAKRRLAAMNCPNVRVFCADGLCGYAAQAPYDGVVICAECGEVPAGIVSQLGAKGRMVLPLRGDDGIVRLSMTDAGGEVFMRREAVRFVPMVAGMR